MFKWVISFSIILYLCSIGLASTADGNSYERGLLYCNDFEEQERTYSADPEDKDNELFYAFCLLVEGEDEKALRWLYYLREYKNSVYAASLIERYLSTGGNFDGDYSANRSEVNEAIQAHQDTLFMLSANPHYPYPDEPVYEYKHQFELYSNHDIPYLYFEKLNTVFLVYTIRFFCAPPATPVTGIWNSIPNTRLTPWKV